VIRGAESISTVLLAGGFGTRVAHLLSDVPKPMAPVAGRPFVDWLIRYFAGCGLMHFILSTGHLSEVIESYFADQPVDGVEVFSRKEGVPLGTGGGFLNATRDFPKPKNGWLVANADTLVATNPVVLVEQARQNDWSAAILGLEASNASRFGTLHISADRTLHSFAEKRSGSGFINAGVYWFAPECLEEFSSKRPLSLELDVFPYLLSEKMRIGVVPVSAPFIDIGTPSSLAEADAFVEKWVRKQKHSNAIAGLD
jgi:D-glycero-alpha-D-manno-heptose 1-phosphate guanylyltransferase